MTILLVDDDRFVIASLLNRINWTELGIDHVYTAYNIDSAKEIILQNPVQIILSDIDMPHGTGLDLLAWIRDNKINVQVLFLTNYADFSYAQKALKLQSFDYFLKPIDIVKLTEVLKEAITKVHIENQVSEYASMAQLYQHNVDKIYEHFWQFYLCKSSFTMPTNNLEIELDKRHLSYTLSDVFYPILINTTTYNLSDQYELICAFDNEQEEFETVKSAFFANYRDLLSYYDVFIKVSLANASYLAIIKCSADDFHKNKQLISMHLENFIYSLNQHHNINLNCFVGNPNSLKHFLPMFEQLKNMNVNSLISKNSVLFLMDYLPPLDNYEVPNMDTLELCLTSNDWDSFVSTSQRYLTELANKNQLSATSLNSFQIDVAQLIYSYCKNQGILAHKLFHGTNYSLLAANARKSMYDMINYIAYVLNIASNYLNFSSSKKSIVKLIQEFVDIHYAEDIDRNCLTDIVYLDPNYASKLFKKETGISFGAYLINKRINIAKELLENTSISINEIADKVGYGNYSYFIRLFKKETSYTPTEYRNLYRSSLT